MSRRQSVVYAGILAGCLVAALAAGWTTLGVQIDNDAYDFLFRIHPPAPRPQSSLILGIDERSFRRLGGLRRVRSILAEGLERIRDSGARAVVVDLILADAGEAAEDARLAEVFRQTPNLILACSLTRDGWEDPLPEFRSAALALGHAHADPDRYDNVVRQVPLEKVAGAERRWALSLEGFRMARDEAQIEESPGGLLVGGVDIPAPRSDSSPRSLLVRYLPRSPETGRSIREITFSDLADNPALSREFAGKVVFVGITAESAAQDRHMTPYSYGQTMPGVEIHAAAYETMAGGVFLEPAANLNVVLFCLLLAGAAGLAFARLTGWLAYAAGAFIIALAHVVPYMAFRFQVIIPYAAPLSACWLSVAAAASYQHFAVRRQLRRSEAQRDRYQQAIHFVAHEMRSPLTAIQGSSELMSRYQLSEEKRSQIARTINSESKRLGKMIQTFLDVERLSAGQMELKCEAIESGDLVRACLERARPLAERKKMLFTLGAVDNVALAGDRELMEYAVYNLLTNAVKYSPSQTVVEVSCRADGKTLRLAVKDQGIGMDEKELRQVFRKFYRTRKAEASGEAGTGIGLSIVEQIVAHHGGKMEVVSAPGQGSCFTIVLPAAPILAKRPGFE